MIIQIEAIQAIVMMAVFQTIHPMAASQMMILIQILKTQLMNQLVLTRRNITTLTKEPREMVIECTITDITKITSMVTFVREVPAQASPKAQSQASLDQAKAQSQASLDQVKAQGQASLIIEAQVQKIINGLQRAHIIIIIA